MKSVLIVEDSATTRAMIKAVIEDMGEDFTALEANTGFEALRMLPQEQFDLIITDINMPDVNGLELINFVKSNPNYQHIPMIIVTTERSSADKERGLALGASAYVTKPFKAEELQEVIAKALSP
ncbi:MAG: response regulator [Nitrospirae bacterium]|nr:response regulator [Nitrospirota bacterium]MCL5422880.1 response regulator [Nitrospirota bacterium]